MFGRTGHVVFIHTDQVDKTCITHFYLRETSGVDMESIYSKFAFHGSKKIVLRLILSSCPYLRSALHALPKLHCHEIN